MLKILHIVILLSFYHFSSSLDSCTPLWPRLQFGNVFYNSSSNQKLIIKFNTKSPCQKSYVVTSHYGKIKKFSCQSKNLKLSQKMNNYQIFIQKCSITDLQFSQKFNYIVYGANSSSSSIPFDTNPVEVNSLIHPNTTKQVNLLVLADWGELNSKIGIYTSINSSLDKIKQSQQIDGTIINGDIAYDLDSRNGTNYQEFLALLTRIGRFVPVFINTGNHQHLSPDIVNIFYFSFEQYGKNKILATGLSLGPIFLIGFDPYEILYTNQNIQKNLQSQSIAVQQSQSFAGFKQILTKAKFLNKHIVTSSHYPFICSVNNPRCSTINALLKDFFSLMLQNQVKLYLSAHMHSYQRIYPYCQNQTFSYTKSPYYLGKQKCFISIIQGTAGNDINVGEDYAQIQNFTAHVENDNTGIGFLSVNKDYATYKHYSSKNVLTLQDQIYLDWRGSSVEGNLIAQEE